jgi:hypothetical protein
VLPGSVLVAEIKLTQCAAGEDQIRQLYRPLLERIFRRPVVGVLVCRGLIFEPGALIEKPEDVIGVIDPRIFTWHWLGR